MKRILGVVLGLLISFCLTTPAAAETVRIGYTSSTLFYFPFFLAQEKGFYKEQGLQAELIRMGRSSVHLQALASGELHFGNINPDGVILFDQKGGNLKVAAGLVNAAPYILVGAKQYKKVSDLKGTKLGVTSLIGGATTFLVEYLKAKGLEYPRDYTLVIMAGGTPARFAALKKGSISAGVLSMPVSDIAIDEGLNQLGDIREIFPKYQFTAVHVNPAWAEKNRPTVVKFLKAHIRTLRWIYDNPEEATKEYTKILKIKEKYARKGIEYFTKNKIFPKDGSVTLDGLKVNIEVQAKAGLIKGPLPSPEDFVDLSYLKQAQKK